MCVCVCDQSRSQRIRVHSNPPTTQANEVAGGNTARHVTSQRPATFLEAARKANEGTSSSAAALVHTPAAIVPCPQEDIDVQGAEDEPCEVDPTILEDLSNEEVQRSLVKYEKGFGAT